MSCHNKSGFCPAIWQKYDLILQSTKPKINSTDHKEIIYRLVKVKDVDDDEEEDNDMSVSANKLIWDTVAKWEAKGIK